MSFNSIFSTRKELVKKNIVIMELRLDLKKNLENNI